MEETLKTGTNFLDPSQMKQRVFPSLLRLTTAENKNVFPHNYTQQKSLYAHLLQ